MISAMPRPSGSKRHVSLASMTTRCDSTDYFSSFRSETVGLPADSVPAVHLCGTNTNSSTSLSPS